MFKFLYEFYAFFSWLVIFQENWQELTSELTLKSIDVIKIVKRFYKKYCFFRHFLSSLSLIPTSNKLNVQIKICFFVVYADLKLVNLIPIKTDLEHVQKQNHKVSRCALPRFKWNSHFCTGSLFSWDFVYKLCIIRNCFWK